jgi:y4mF family transcriptional regulator
MKIKSVKDIGEWIKAERKRQGLTQKQLAGLLGVGERFLVEIEGGKATAEIGKVLHVLTNLGARIDIAAKVER